MHLSTIHTRHTQSANDDFQPMYSRNRHWLIQKADQRGIDQARRSNGSGGGGEWAQLNGSSNNKMTPRNGSNDNKPLPDAITFR